MKQTGFLPDLLRYLKAQSPSPERDALICSVEARLPQDERPHKPCRIDFAVDEQYGALEQRYPYWNAHMRDGSICAGCGDYNDYGHGGYCGELCYQCHAAEGADRKES